MVETDNRGSPLSSGSLTQTGKEGQVGSAKSYSTGSEDKVLQGACSTGEGGLCLWGVADLQETPAWLLAADTCDHLLVPAHPQ